MCEPAAVFSAKNQPTSLYTPEDSKGIIFAYAILGSFSLLKCRVFFGSIGHCIIGYITDVKIHRYRNPLQKTAYELYTSSCIVKIRQFNSLPIIANPG